jgi:hypothetical protein
MHTLQSDDYVNLETIITTAIAALRRPQDAEGLSPSAVHDHMTNDRFILESGNADAKSEFSIIASNATAFDPASLTSAFRSGLAMPGHGSSMTEPPHDPIAERLSTRDEDDRDRDDGDHHPGKNR